jgi:hypothetical protein
MNLYLETFSTLMSFKYIQKMVCYVCFLFVELLQRLKMSEMSSYCLS